MQTVAAACTRIAVVLSLALASSLAAAAPAAAHDGLSSTSPADGEEVASSPEAVVLNFSEAPLSLGTRTVVTGPDGSVVTVGDAQLEQNRVSQQLQPQLPSGTYRVTWRVTSTDGHPVSGEFSFSVRINTAVQPGAGETPPSAESSTPPSGSEQGTPPPPTAAPEAAGTAGLTPEGDGTGGVVSTEVTGSGGDGGVSAGAALTGSAALALVAGLLVLFGKRRRQAVTRAEATGPRHGSSQAQAQARAAGSARALVDGPAPEKDR